MKNTRSGNNGRLDIMEEKVSEIEDVQRDTLNGTEERLKTNSISELHSGIKQLITCVIRPQGAGVPSGCLLEALLHLALLELWEFSL